MSRPTTCKDHTYGPEGYLGWHEWAEKKAKTHDQFQCDECGLWTIWRRRLALPTPDPVNQ